MTFWLPKKVDDVREKQTPKTFPAKTLDFRKKNIFSSQMLMIIKKNEIYIRSYFYSNGNMARPRILPIFGVDYHTSAT